LLTTLRNEHNTRQTAREYYLLGQVYQHLGDNTNAFQAYGKVSRLSPPYELEFNSKIKQTEVVSNKKSESIVKQLHRMARNKKNGEYLDQIYYAIGNVYLAKQDTIHAIEQYKIGVEKSTRGGLEKGLILLTLGNIYWQQADYVQAQKCYAEVIGLLDKEHSAYAEVNKRSEVLDELVTHVVSVQLQDSLQHLATLSEAERMRIVEKIIEELKKKEEEEKKEAEHQALMEKREEMMGDNSFGNNNNRPVAPKPIVPTGDKSWYFYNQQLLTQGKASFQRKWGRRKLEDNWNRRNKTVIAGEEFAKVNYDEEEKKQTDSIATDGIGTDSLSTDTVITDTKNPQFYLQQIPVTEEMMKESNDILSDGLFNMGMIYKDKLEDYRLAEQSFNRLYTRFPNYKALDEAYYNLYLMLARQKKMTQANECKSTLIKLFPESKYSITLSDPDYAYNIIHGKHLEDSLYTLTYAAYSEGNYQKVKNNYLTASKKYAMGQHLPKFMFLNAMSMLQTGEKDKFMNALKEVVEKYPKDEISELAAYMVKGLQDGRLLASDGSALGSIWKRRKADAAKGEFGTDSLLPAFSAERNTPYLFMLAYEDGKVNENLLLYEIARYNFSNFIVKNFDLSFVKENGIAMLQIKEFTNFDEAYQYHKLLYADKGMAKKLSGMRVVIISLSNFEILKKYYSFDDYATFHEKNFSTIPEPEIDGYTLDDPIYKEELPQEEEE
ncbi:MAG: tetratricopeptide repeat protein, partial [Bacteroides sp.]